MKTIVTIAIEHPAPSAGMFIDTAIRPFVADMAADLPEGWGVSLTVSTANTIDLLAELEA
jgi:hypothetical protein